VVVIEVARRRVDIGCICKGDLMEFVDGLDWGCERILHVRDDLHGFFGSCDWNWKVTVRKHGDQARWCMVCDSSTQEAEVGEIMNLWSTWAA
jgi:hypothetical protein